MSERCPPNLDEDGRSLWQQCSWILEGGATAPEANLQLQALFIRRVLRLESRHATELKWANAELKRVLDATGMVKHTKHEDCEGCGCMSLTPSEAVGALREELEKAQNSSTTKTT